MTHPSNTPPDGDFVRYVERLTAGQATPVTGAREAMLHQPQSTVERVPQLASPSDFGLPPPASSPLAGIAFMSHVKWLVGAWIGTQILSAFVPWADFLFVPVLLVYVAWIVFRLNKNGSGALAERLRQVLAHAVEEARKAQQTHQKKNHS